MSRSAAAHDESVWSEAVARMATNWGPCQAAIDLRNSPQGRAHDARVPNAGTRMCRREAPKVDCELAGQTTAWMPEVEQRKEQLPEARRASGRGGLLFGYISLTPGILPSALRASSAVRAAPAAQCPRKRK